MAAVECFMVDFMGFVVSKTSTTSSHVKGYNEINCGLGPERFLPIQVLHKGLSINESHVTTGGPLSPTNFGLRGRNQTAFRKPIA